MGLGKETYTEIVCRTVIFLIGVPGNLLVFYFFLLIKRSQNFVMFNFLISCMAFTDLIACIFPEISLVMTVLLDENFACKYFYFIPMLSSELSLSILFFMSLDRYRRITKPFGRQCTKTVFQVFTALFIISAVLVYSPYFDMHYLNKKMRICETDSPPSNKFVLVATHIGYALIVFAPILAIVAFYLTTRRFLNNQHKFVKQMSQSKATGKDISISNHTITAVRTLKTLTMIMLITVLLPRIFLTIQYSLTIYSARFRDSRVFYGIRSLVYNILISNNAINIFVYMYHIKGFRKFVLGKKLICCVKKSRYVCDEQNNKNQMKVDA